MKCLSVPEARAFAQKWLPAWTGNNPELLASFYSEDAFYLDPTIPGGVKGRPALLTYFRRLLGYNPNWVWTQIEAIPLEDGFLNKWFAKIPVGSKSLDVVGVCLVQLDATGKIRRNEVYFDRYDLLSEIARQRKGTRYRFVLTPPVDRGMPPATLIGMVNYGKASMVFPKILYYHRSL